MILVTGGSGGLGKAVVDRLNGDVLTIGKHDCDIGCDFSSESSILSASINCQVDAIIHCAGVNHIEPHQDLTLSEIEYTIRVNAIAPFLLERRIMNTCNSLQKSIHVISDAAWTPMTHSLAYNMSKAAQLMMMRQMAHECKDYVICGVSPGKIAGTGMSNYIDNTFPKFRGMTYDEGRKYQLSRLKTGEMDVDTVAEFIVDIYHLMNKHYHGHNFCIGG